MQNINLQNEDDVKSLGWLQAKDDADLERNGVYAILGDTEDFQYIGQGVNIKSRIDSHRRKGIYKDGENSILFLAVKDRNQRCLIEKRCIEILEPPLNKTGGITPTGYGRKKVPDNYGDQVRARGIGIKNSEWDKMEKIAKELDSNSHALTVWAIRDFLRRYEDGELPIVERPTLPGLGS